MISFILNIKKVSNLQQQEKKRPRIHSKRQGYLENSLIKIIYRVAILKQKIIFKNSMQNQLPKPKNLKI
jgi:hypothetical protein